MLHRLLHLRGQRAGIDSQAQGRDQHRGCGDLGGQGLKPLICGGRVAVLVELGEHASDEDLPTTCHRPAYWSHSVIGM